MSVFIVHKSGSDTDCPRGPVAFATTLLVTEGTSASVTIWKRVPVVDWPGASVVVPSVTTPYTSSVTVTLVRVTSPVLETLKQ